MGSPCWLGLCCGALWKSLTRSILRFGGLVTFMQPPANTQGSRYFPVIYTWNQDEADKDIKIWNYRPCYKAGEKDILTFKSPAETWGPIECTMAVESCELHSLANIHTWNLFFNHWWWWLHQALMRWPSPNHPCLFAEVPHSLQMMFRSQLN